MVDISQWPKQVRQLEVSDIDYLGVDDKKKIYWDGSPIVTSPLSNLNRGEKIAAWILGIVTILGGLGGFAQGWVAYNDWACKMQWRIAVCPSANIKN